MTKSPEEIYSEQQGMGCMVAVAKFLFIVGVLIIFALGFGVGILLEALLKF